MPETTRDLMDGDLVLRRDTQLDQQHGRKLETRWLGPFKIARLSKFKRSAILIDTATGLKEGRYHVNHLKRFVPRMRHGMSRPEATAELIKIQKKVIKEQLKKGSDSIEEAGEAASEPQREAPMLWPYGDEGWEFWKMREVNLQF